MLTTPSCAQTPEAAAATTGVLNVIIFGWCKDRGGDVIVIRPNHQADAESVGRLIADTYSKFNLSFAPPEERPLFLGPFKHARSHEESHRAAIAQVIRAAMVFVAEDAGEIVGVLRGRKVKLQSLFVREDYHRQGVGRRLVEQFEQECARQEAEEIKVQAALYAVPFYLAMGYKRTTGTRQSITQKCW